VNLLGTADKPHRRKPKAPLVKAAGGGLDNLRMVGQAQIIIGTEIQHRPIGLYSNTILLRTDNNPLVFIQAVTANLIECFT